MTILNVSITPERALVAVDVMGALPDSLEPYETSKMMPFVHCNAVLAGSGNIGMAHHAFIQLARNQGDFDFMAGALATLVDQAYTNFLAEARAVGFIEAVLSQWQTIVFVGWSPAHGRSGRTCGDFLHGR